MKNTILLLILTFFFYFSNAQKKIYTISRLTGEEIEIDGVFDENIWKTGEWSNEFTQYRPNNGAQPSQLTEFKLLYDDSYIYIAVKAFDSEPDKIDKRISRRDNWEGDRVNIQIDSYNDKRTAFNFCVNAGGAKNDGIGTNDGDNFDDTWDPVWFVKTSITNYGWNVEAKIPLSQLRFSNKEKQTWGFQLVRNIYRTQELNLWQHIPEDAPGYISNFGEIKGINNIQPKRRIEIAPYGMSKIDLYEKEAGNPFADGKDFGFEAGIDGKIGLTNDLTLDFAVNPDFGQVEADPSEVNLSAFESFFSEKRLFFVEGSNITDYQLTPGGSPWSSDNLFYSRRIGRSPQGYPNYSEGEYAKIPRNTRILGSLKLTGKTQKGWSIGILESVTNEEKAIIDNAGERRKDTIEPYTNYFLARVQKDINKGNTIIGGMVTSTYRNIKNKSLNFLNKTATTGGIDFTQYFKERKYYLTAKFSGSHITGSEEAILRQQESSRRYYQRPDVNYLTLDTTRTSLSGHGGTLSFGKNGNSGWRYSAAVTYRTPGYETNDMGYLRKANSIFQYSYLGYSFTKPFSIFRIMNINANQWAGWDFGGVKNFFGGNLSFWTQLKNLWTVRASVSAQGLEVDNTGLRGGPALHLPGNFNYSVSFGTNTTKKLSLHTGFHDNFKFQNSGRSYGIWGFITYRPLNSLSLSLFPSYNYSNSEMQYVTRKTYNGEDRYIFAQIEQKTVNLTIRIDYCITPEFSIQYYGSPFVSGGLYSDYKKITDSKADDFEDRYHTFNENEIEYVQADGLHNIYESQNPDADYNFENPDYNFKQFRSNLVLRWEYSPGSLLYLVWSQGRTDFASDGRFNYLSDMKNLFSGSAQNVILLKFSYRFRN